MKTRRVVYYSCLSVTMRVFRKRKKYDENNPPLPDIVYQMAAEQAVRFVALHPPLQNSYDSYNVAEQDPFYNNPYVPVPVAENSINGISGAEIGEPVRTSSPLNFLSSMMRRGRSRVREQFSNGSRQSFGRVGSPEQFRRGPLGSSVNFHQRPLSPQLVGSRPTSPYQFGRRERSSSPYQFGRRERSSSPYHYVQQEQSPPTYHYVTEERTSSPQRFIPVTRSSPADVARRLQLAQLSQELQYAERQQRRQQESMMSLPAQFNTQYQQPYYPVMNTNLNMQGYSMTQQAPMYSFY
jgi:hypothetical protein